MRAVKQMTCHIWILALCLKKKKKKKKKKEEVGQAFLAYSYQLISEEDYVCSTLTLKTFLFLSLSKTDKMKSKKVDF